ncbi:flagellar hook-associated family protein [Hoeflea poritis]|uniref:Flagellin n=1 Tax=Hoeflea poritis TaxID=2993659 RepID=A0ABT4VU74_9HYPH|nr:flagellar hook-associated family protein [Hoeflea poritis]MDA4847538.1 flagellar hook-associated family protein [Hoeflea poritis]
MKTTFVSTLAIQSALRLTVQRAQAEMMNAQTEATTGRHADIGLELGAQTAKTISLNRDVARLHTIIDSNALVTNRLSSSQNALEQMANSAQQVLDTLISMVDINDRGRLDVAAETVQTAFQNFTSFANSSANGEFLFAGINTDVKPLADYTEGGSAAKASFDAAYLAYFGFTQNDAAASGITTAQLDDFLTNQVEPLILGAGWNTDWSSADDQVMTNRINTNEVIDSSATINADGPQKMAMASTIVMEMLSTPLSSDTRQELVERAIDYVAQAITGIDFQRAQLGLSEQRIEKANDSIQVQIDLMSVYIGELENVDVYEASTRLTLLLTQVETSYTLTARIQQLSLTNYL